MLLKADVVVVVVVVGETDSSKSLVFDWLSPSSPMRCSRAAAAASKALCKEAKVASRADSLRVFLCFDRDDERAVDVLVCSPDEAIFSFVSCLGVNALSA